MAGPKLSPKALADMQDEDVVYQRNSVVTARVPKHLVVLLDQAAGAQKMSRSNLLLRTIKKELHALGYLPKAKLNSMVGE